MIIIGGLVFLVVILLVFVSITKKGSSGGGGSGNGITNTNTNEKEEDEVNIITTFAGTGTSGSGGDGSSASSAQLNIPQGIVVDTRNGDVYIADTGNHRIRKVSSGDGTITTFAGTGTSGSGGDDSSASSAQLNGPQGIVVDTRNGDVYIADTGNHKIRKVSSGGGTITTFAGTGTFGSGGDGSSASSAQLNGPTGLTIDTRSGDVYIADAGNHKIRKVSSGDGTITTFAGTGTDSYGGDGSSASSAQLNSPTGLVIDTMNGDVYIADAGNHRIRKVSSGDGTITTFAGTGTDSYGGDGSIASSAYFSTPYDVQIDTRNNHMYISDSYNNRIRKIVLR